MATQVRTEDEHPLRQKDVRQITGHFRRVETRWYWLSTLSIFILMAAWQRRNPNRERYWKAVVKEADRWARFYRPLARVDEALLRLVPALRWWCWNVLIFGWEPIAQPGSPAPVCLEHPSPMRVGRSLVPPSEPSGPTA
jgi:hypothetical protein